jgi:DNA methylase
MQRIVCMEALDFLRSIPTGSVDLVMCSPPYEDARAYGDVGFNLKGEAWVEWAKSRYLECVRICKGLVVWVVEGKTRKFRWSATPALLMADLHRSGVKLRKPPAFYRAGISGSGGPDFFRNDYEFCVCSSHGKLPWSDNTATGKPPKYKAGGQPSHRTKNGSRVNASAEPKIVSFMDGNLPGSKLHTKNDGKGMRVQCYTPPTIANPGNVIKCSVGGGRMGSKLSHENEAPYPEQLAEAFIRSFCPPGGTVCDPFSGSGTTAAVSVLHGRGFIVSDIRQSQVDLTRKRILEKITKMQDCNDGLRIDAR